MAATYAIGAGTKPRCEQGFMADPHSAAISRRNGRKGYPRQFRGGPPGYPPRCPLGGGFCFIAGRGAPSFPGSMSHVTPDPRLHDLGLAALAGEALSPSDALVLYRGLDQPSLGLLANDVRLRLVPRHADSQVR